MNENIVGNAFLSSPYASFILDWHGRIVVCNRRAERSFGIDNLAADEQLQGVLFSDLTSGTEGQTLLEIRKGAATGSVELHMAKALERKISPAGTMFRVSLMQSTTRGERLILLTQDHLKATADSLRTMNERRAAVERKFKDAKAVNTQLYETLISMEAFAHAASHDLKTPINTLIGSLQFFSHKYSEDLSPDAQEFLSVMSRAAHQLNTLTTDLLDHSVSTARRLRCKDVRLYEAINEVIADLSQEINSVDASVKIIGSDILAHADPNLLRMVLANLLNNAIKFRDEEKKLEIVFVLESASRKKWKINIIDNGRGFDSADADKILLPFHRVHEDVEGSGVGLATCAEICRRHNWLFTATAMPGNGATFSIGCELD